METPSQPTRRRLQLSEVAALFDVHPDTIRRWAVDGRIPSFKTLGGQLRFYADEIEPLAAAATTSRTEAV